MRTSKESIEAMKTQLLIDMRKVSLALSSHDEYEAMHGIETFCAIAFRVFSKTNVSKLKSEMVNVELQSRLVPGGKILT